VETARKVRQSRCDVAYVNADLSPSLWLTLSLRLAGVAGVVVHSQNSRFDAPKGVWKTKAYQRALRLLATRLAANAPECAVGTFGCSDGVSFVPSIIDFESLSRDAAAVSRNRDGAEFNLACIGRLAEQKNISFAIRLMARLRHADLKARLLIAGEGPLLGGLLGLCRDLSVEDRVEFVGPVVNIAEFLVKNVDAVLIPSLFEGQVRVLGEAQCVGLPVLASAGVPKTAWICDDPLSRAGLPLDESIWAQEIVSLFSDAHRSTELQVRYPVDCPQGLPAGARRLSRLIQEAADKFRRRQETGDAIRDAAGWPDLGPRAAVCVGQQQALSK
jgi:glycosyltransferase involved in cell wall biosynthesis